jgi:hypothetical protein
VSDGLGGMGRKTKGKGEAMMYELRVRAPRAPLVLIRGTDDD